MPSGYHGLSDIKDPATQRTLKLLMDRIGSLEGQAGAIGTVSQPLTAPMNAGSQRITALADPSHPQDAVSLRYLQSYVESRVGVSVAAAISTVPGAPGGPPVTTPTNPTQPPSGNPVTGALTRGFDLSQVTIYNSPTDIAAWPVTGSITALSILPGQGVLISSPKISLPNTSPPPAPGCWPQDQVSYPDAVGLQYTVWVLLNVAGAWAGAGFIQCWIGRPGTGSSPLGTEFANLWAYSNRWGPLNGQIVTPGTQMGFLASAGNARGYTGVSTVRERTEVVLLSAPDANGGTYM
jgi:hypothetical protein